MKLRVRTREIDSDLLIMIDYRKCTKEDFSKRGINMKIIDNKLHGNRLCPDIDKY